MQAGVVDGYFSKVEASSVSIGSMMLLYLIWLALGYIDVTKDKYKQHAKVLSAIRYAILLIGFGCNLFALLARLIILHRAQLHLILDLEHCFLY